MEDSQSVLDRIDWNAVQMRQARGGVKGPHQRRRRWIDAAVLIVGAVAAHGTIGYFGWSWITANRAAPAATTIAPLPTPVGTHMPEQKQVETLPTSDRYNGTMRWTRRDGLTIAPVETADEPVKSADWKCVGGFYFTMKKDAAGTTVVEGVTHNRRPLRC